MYVRTIPRCFLSEYRRKKLLEVIWCCRSSQLSSLKFFRRNSMIQVWHRKERSRLYATRSARIWNQGHYKRVCEKSKRCHQVLEDEVSGQDSNKSVVLLEKLTRNYSLIFRLIISFTEKAQSSVPRLIMWRRVRRTATDISGHKVSSLLVALAPVIESTKEDEVKLEICCQIYLYLTHSAWFIWSLLWQLEGG